MSTTEVVVQSRDVLTTHERSFRGASRFLPADGSDDAAVVYAFCRLVDDLADEAVDEERAIFDLDLVERELDGTSDARPLIAAFLEVTARRGIDVRSAKELIAGVRSDLGTVRMASDAELLRYCYRVAGTVGLMMCGILGVEDTAGHPHAIDLGVGMQITNICRDVLEDAHRGRCYLPADRLRAAGVDPADLIAGKADPDAVASVVRDLLEVAEEYYLSADRGMRYIPARSRFAIVVASRLYRGIGVKLMRRHDGNALHGRTMVTRVEKIGLLGASVVHLMSPRVLGLDGDTGHNTTLHVPLQGMPGASS